MDSKENNQCTSYTKLSWEKTNSTFVNVTLIGPLFLLKAVNCPLPKPPSDGRIVHDKPSTGTTTKYGQAWTYECNPPKAPSYERGFCMANGGVTEPPVCRGMQTSTFVLDLHKKLENFVALNVVSIFFYLKCFWFFYEIAGNCLIPIQNLILDVSCPIPTNIPNGIITFAVMRQHGYKEKVRYACSEHYVLEGRDEIQCQNTGNWSSKPVCRGES